MVVGQGTSMYFGGLLEKKIGARLTILIGCIVNTWVGRFKWVTWPHLRLSLSSAAAISHDPFWSGRSRQIRSAPPDIIVSKRKCLAAKRITQYTCFRSAVFFSYWSIESFYGLILTYGLIFGVGIGLCYSTTMTLAIKVKIEIWTICCIQKTERKLHKFTPLTSPTNIPSPYSG